MKMDTCALQARLRTRRVRMPQIRSMALQLGIRPNQNRERLLECIGDINEQDPDSVGKAYRSVILGQSDAAPTGPSLEQIGQVIDKRMKEVDERIESKVAAIATGLTDEERQQMRDSIVAEVREHALKSINSFRPIEIRTGDKRVRLQNVVLPEEFERMVQLASQRVNIMLVGPTGCGKTYVAGQLAKATKARRFAALSCTAGMSESQLSGWLLPTGAGGKFEYQASPFIDIYENGGVFLLDEIDAADPNVLVFLNTAIAGDSFHLPQRFGKPEVKKHKDFVLVCAANTFGSGADARYVGRNQLDAATLDRFRVGLVLMDYSEKVERNIADPDVYDWCVRVRAAIAKHGLRREMSTRTMVDLTKMRRAYKWEEQDFADAYFASWPDNERQRIENELKERLDVTA